MKILSDGLLPAVGQIVMITRWKKEYCDRSYVGELLDVIAVDDPFVILSPRNPNLALGNKTFCALLREVDLVIPTDAFVNAFECKKVTPRELVCEVKKNLQQRQSNVS